MRKITYTLLLSMAFASAAIAQDMNAVFKKMPRDIIYGLNPDLNEQLLENPKDTSKFVSTAIYDEIKRKELNSEYIALQTSDAGTTQIRLLPLINGSKIVCVVQTVCGTICDSKVSFYTDDWKLIDASALFPKQDGYWFVKAEADRNSESFRVAMAAIIMNPMKVTLSPNETTMSLELDAKSFMSMEDYKLVEPFLDKNPKVLIWDKATFK